VLWDWTIGVVVKEVGCRCVVVLAQYTECESGPCLWCIGVGGCDRGVFGLLIGPVRWGRALMDEDVVASAWICWWYTFISEVIWLLFTSTTLKIFEASMGSVSQSSLLYCNNGATRVNGVVEYDWDDSLEEDDEIDIDYEYPLDYLNGCRSLGRDVGEGGVVVRTGEAIVCYTC